MKSCYECIYYGISDEKCHRLKRLRNIDAGYDNPCKWYELDCDENGDLRASIERQRHPKFNTEMLH